MKKKYPSPTFQSNPKQHPESFTEQVPAASPFYAFPTSPAGDLVSLTLVTSGDMELIKERKKKINHSQEVTTLNTTGTRRGITVKNGKSKITLQVSDIDTIAKGNKAAKKLFTLALIEANKQAVFNGVQTQDGIVFSLQKLVDIGFYSSVRAARAGFNTGMEALTSIKIKGNTSIKANGKRMEHSTKQDGFKMSAVLFPTAAIKNGQCYIRLNPDINWAFFTQYYTILPTYYFRLPSRPSDLLLSISYLARQHSREITEQGHFNMSFRTLQMRLNLPNEKDTKDPGRTIKQPIEEAIERIEEEENKTPGGLYLLPVYSEAASISTWLDEGYLQVSYTGESLAHFADRSAIAKQKTEESNKRKEKRIQAAISAKSTKEDTPKGTA